MENQFVTYEIAKALKELGFNKPCFGKFVDKGFHALHDGWKPNFILVPQTQYENESPITFCQERSKYQSNLNPDILLAPLWQQAIDWLFKEHQIYIGTVLINTYTKHWEVSHVLFTEVFDNREKAFLKALKLIKTK